MSILTSIFSDSAKDILNEGGKIVDSLTTNTEDKLNAKNELTNIVLTSLNKIQNAQKEIIMSETQGTKLQRSWRPIVMLAFAFIVVYAYFIEPAFLSVENPISATLKPEFWELLKLGLGGYVIGRSAEKIAGTVTKNTDITFLRKKDRKDALG